MLLYLATWSLSTWIICKAHHIVLYLQRCPSPALGYASVRKQQPTCIIRWCSTYNHQSISIKRNVCSFGIIAKRRANSLWQTGRRFMCTLAYSYGVTRRRMTQCISASLLVLDRWSRPNMTVPSLILPQKAVWTLYTVAIDSGDLLEMSKNVSVAVD